MKQNTIVHFKVFSNTIKKKLFLKKIIPSSWTIVLYFHNDPTPIWKNEIKKKRIAVKIPLKL